MKFLQTARRKARECRNAVGISPAELLERIERYLWEKYKIELVAVDADVIDGGRAELRPDEGCLYYDEKLNDNRDEKLFVIAHELGHLELHPRLTRGCAEPDPVYGSMYGIAGADSLTRYNSRSREEAEANAFAAEFLCPSDEVFKIWLNKPSDASVEKLADALGAPVFIVYSQLAEALYQKFFVAETLSDSLPADEEKCDPKQEEAATFMGAPVIVSAGPGTGKTKTLVRRIEFLIEKGEIEPENFLVVTFSNEAATELYERISQKFGEETAARLTITTFHGFGLSVLQHHGQFQNVDVNAYILDDAAQTELLSEILGKADCRNICNHKNLDETAEEIARHINFLKQRLITAEEFEKILTDWQSSEEEGQGDKREKADELLKIFKKYEEVKDNRQRLDFADLILKPIKIFRAKPAIAEQYRRKFRAVLVDEYQDVSRATAKLLQHICGENNPPWVVGDKRQSIFGFCGAAPDNIDEFSADFPGAKNYDLEINYRSCGEVVETSNQMAGLMFAEDNEERSIADIKKIWRSHEDNPCAVFQPVISVAVANSDQAEYEGIADQIEEWISKGVPFADIAVLSRRNIDVREIVMALSRKKIPAIASGVVTPDGTAGDLAAIITLADKPSASLVKLAYCLGKDRFSFEVLDNLIKTLRTNDGYLSDFNGIKFKESAEIADEIKRTCNTLEKVKFSGDAFDMICAFLFDGSDYLRRILASEDEAKRSLALAEIIATLMRAAAYRFSHRGTPPDVARRNFAEHFRKSLANSNAPCLSPPAQKSVPAVKVMTCHAAKGLEFPFVIVAGQARSKRSENNEFQWLPSVLQPKKSEDKNQIDSVLFVGATRARQMLIISYAATSSGLPRAEKRIVAPLLESWRDICEPTRLEWTNEVQENPEVEFTAIWGGTIEHPLAARSLDKDVCSIATYLQEAVKLEFPVEEKPLYPIFFTVVRRAMRKIVEQVFEKGQKIDKTQAVQILMREWNKSVNPQHKHHDLFLGTAKNYVVSFAEKFVPEKGNVEFFDLILEDSNNNGNGNAVLFDLVCAYQVADNEPIAILFRPESFDSKDLRENGLLWSSLSAKKRVSFVLLKTFTKGLRAKIFSGEDGVFYDYQWNTRGKYLETETARLAEKRSALTNGRFITTIKDYNCKKCSNRINCPFWMRVGN